LEIDVQARMTESAQRALTQELKGIYNSLANSSHDTSPRESERRVKQLATDQSRKEAEAEWGRFQSMIQNQKLQTEAMLSDAKHSERFEEAGQLKTQREHLMKLLKDGEKLKQRAGPGQAEQQVLKRQLEELSVSIAHGPQRSRLRGTELEELHSAPFDIQNDVPFSSSVQRELGIDTTTEVLFNDVGMRVLYAVRVVKELSARSFNDRWTLYEVVGFGGSGVVVRAMDADRAPTDREVALKIVVPTQGLVFGNEEERRHKREKLAMQRVNHPNIVKFYESHYDPGKRIYFMVMEFAAGISLAELLKRTGPLPQQKLLEVAILVCEVLHAMHEQNIIHLDVKPQNVMYQEKDGTWSIKLIDFGLAQASSQKQGERENTTMMTKNESVAGTLLFMPPEQLEKKMLDARSDVFAAGVTLYQLSCGRFPHQASCSSAADTIVELRSWRRKPPPLLKQQLPSIDQGFARIIAKAIDVDPRKRFQTAAEMLPKLAELRRDEPIDLGVLSSGSAGALLSEKFVAGKLIAGRPEEAALGITHYMGIDAQREGQIKQDGLRAIRAEFEQNGTPADKANMRYVLDEPAREEEELTDYGMTVKDKGHQGMQLGDFMALPAAQAAKLELPHVAALRIYTSNAYTCINNPLRKGCKKEEPHPYAATTLFLSEALRRLRVTNAHGAETQRRKEFWRGMKNLEITEDFRLHGGTELACMSTSTSQDIVAGYAKSKQPLVFKLVSDDFLSCGADVSWLSVYPAEAEILYPPLTYLKYVKTTRIKNSSGFVVEVKPSFST
jgi:serine/threonine protein kinase